MSDLADAEIVAERLRKSFGQTVAVHDVSFRVARGEIIGFLGPNGAGKSTTIRMLTGVFPPSSGRATLAGHDVVRDGLAARAQLGYLPEKNPLYGDMTVREYLRFVAEMKGLAAGRATTVAVDRAMDQAAITHVSHRLTGDLSKGYRQRVGIAQALLGDPRVLILDEPTSGLDPEQVSEVRSLIRALGGERTVILSSHILFEVESICSRVMILHRGRILAQDEPRNLERRLRDSQRLVLRVGGEIGAIEAAIRRVPHVLDVETGGPFHGNSGLEWELRVGCSHGVDVRREIAASVVGCGAGLLELRPHAMTLEEIFLTLVGSPKELQ